jgi:hypothetical protein
MNNETDSEIIEDSGETPEGAIEDAGSIEAAEDFEDVDVEDMIWSACDQTREEILNQTKNETAKLRSEIEEMRRDIMGYIQNELWKSMLSEINKSAKLHVQKSHLSPVLEIKQPIPRDPRLRLRPLTPPAGLFEQGEPL